MSILKLTMVMRDEPNILTRILIIKNVEQIENLNLLTCTTYNP